MNAKRTRNYYDMFAIMFNSQKSYRKYIENTQLGLLTETHEYYFGSLKHQIFIYSRWRHPPKTISPRPYCRSRRGRNGLGSETTLRQDCDIKLWKPIKVILNLVSYTTSKINIVSVFRGTGLILMIQKLTTSKVTFKLL